MLSRHYGRSESSDRRQCSHRRGCGVGLSTGSRSSASGASTRLTVLISDLHLGVGIDPKNDQWHPIEDFRWQEEFALFLKAIDQKGKGATDLIINGDAFELWESIEWDCSNPDKNLVCTESEALNRLQRIVVGHRSELRALGEFAGYWRHTENARWEFAAPARGGITPCKEWLVSSSEPYRAAPPAAFPASAR